MNIIDLENIKKELAKREAANYAFEEGGDMSKDDITLRTTEELNVLVKEFNENTSANASVTIKKIVDEMFEKYAEEDDNMILLSAAFCPERTVYEVEEPFDCINFGWEKYNKLYFPICKEWGDDDYVEYTKDVDRIKAQLSKVDGACYDAEKFYERNNEALNECWYGVIGIMKDYRLVTFVIRDDGMLCDEGGYTTFHNKILYQF